MKILIVTEYFYPEEFKINEIALVWQKMGYQVDVLTQNPTYPIGKIYDGHKNKWFSKDIYEGINIYRVKAVTGYRESVFKKLLKYFTFMIIGSIVSLKIGKRYDYVFGFDIAALSGMVPAILLKKFYKKSVTIWIQDIWPDSIYAYGFRKTKLREFTINGFVKFVYKHSSNLAISGEGFKNRILPFVDKEKRIEYLPNWADELNIKLKPFKLSKENKIHFTFAGNIGKVQNLDNVIKGFANLPEKELKKVQLNIIGDGSLLQDLQNLVKEHNFQNIVFWGRQPREDMYKYYDSSNFLIVSLVDKPIFSLTVPAKIQTYIAVKKPILAIINGDTANIVKENNLGYYTNPNDVEEITKVFIKAIHISKKQKLEFIKSSEKLTETIFNKEKIIKSLLDLTIGQKK